jgi:uncharacterized repeat protein (TIGR03803 family)
LIAAASITLCVQEAVMARVCRLLLCAAATTLVVGTTATAQSFTALAHFSGEEGEPTAGLIPGRDGAYYGTTRSGGIYAQGSIFKLTVHGSAVSFDTLHAFKGPDGAAPAAPLVEASDGFFYGTTSAGGSSGAGTVFRIDRRGRVHVLSSFDGITSGRAPTAALIQATDGLLYGTTFGGGAGNSGTVFRLDRSGAITVLHAFDYWSTGASSQAPLLQARDGLLYGTTSAGGTSGQGVLFSIDTGGSLRVLHSFNERTTGSIPATGVIQARDGLFYGTTFNGGSDGEGTLFRANAAGVVTVLRSFELTTSGGHPLAPLVEGRDGLLYGTTSSGAGQGFGAAFRVDPAGALVVLHAFELNTTGKYPSGALLEVRAGVFYGTTARGGMFGPGTIFEISRSGDASVLHAFKPGVGVLPLAALMQASNGSFYGLTRQRGGYDMGAVFRMKRSGALRRLYTFDGSVGALPSAALLEGPDGGLYGTAEGGGARGRGSVFRVPRTGRVELLHSFDTSSGEDPIAPLVRGSDGLLYGTTCWGGTFGNGIVFRMDDAGAVAILTSFDFTTGACPMAAVVEGDDGAFYGTTFQGGPSGSGTIFRVDKAGQLTVLHAFDPKRTGAFPMSALVKGDDHSFYGTAYGGGIYNFGTVFRVSPDGDIQVLNAFDGTMTGGYPAGSLLRASDGFLYGTTSAGFWGTTEAGPASGFGTVFRIDRRGIVTVLHTFDRAHGGNPVAALMQADDGALYGTAALGGAFGGGVAFRLSLLAVTVVTPNGGEVLHPGNTTDISWTAAGATAFDVELSRDGGNTFRPVRRCTALPGSVRSCT